MIPKRHCKECGKILLIKRAMYCDSCFAIRDRRQRKEALARYREGVLALPINRQCKKCGEVKDHFKGQNTCKDCHRVYLENKSVKIKTVKIEDGLPSDDLFYKLINKARKANHPSIKKARTETISRALELEQVRNFNLIGEL